MRKALLSLSTAGLVAMLNSGCATDGEGTNWGAVLLEAGSAAAQIHGATNTKITPQQRVNSMVIGNSLHNLAVMQNNMNAAKAGKTTVVVNQPTPVYAQQSQPVQIIKAPDYKPDYKAFACNEQITDENRFVKGYKGKGKIEFNKNEPIHFFLQTYNKKGSVVVMKAFVDDNKEPFGIESKVLEYNDSVEGLILNNPRRAGKYRFECYVDGSPQPIRVVEIKVVDSE
ncbi:MAG: hypothetical protein Q8L27_02780 [archaeon]|nr:hypothetical protein [archaeon]